jgi:hypothetical protein
MSGTGKLGPRLSPDMRRLMETALQAEPIESPEPPDEQKPSLKAVS